MNSRNKSRSYADSGRGRSYADSGRGRSYADSGRGRSCADGAQGPVGPQGPAGQDGQDGQDGVDGQDGAQGPAGPQGPAGQDGQDADPAVLQAMQNQIDNLQDQINSHHLDSASCADLQFSGTVWGQQFTGIDLRAFTNSTLHLIGCVDRFSCAPSTFFCNDTAIGITFGTNDATAFERSLRAMVDPGDANGDSLTSGPWGCCSPSNPNAVCNAPDKQADAQALCKSLGYANGSVDQVGPNTCPEVHSLDADGTNWTSDWSPTGGYGKVFTCSN